MAEPRVAEAQTPSRVREFSRPRAAFSLLVGLVVMAAGMVFRYIYFTGGDEGISFTLTWIGMAEGAIVIALLAASIARPLGPLWMSLGAWPIAALLAVIMPIVAFVHPPWMSSLIPAAFETAGAIAILVAVLRWSQAKLHRMVPPVAVDGKQKIKVITDDGDKKVVASSLVAGDRYRLSPGDDVPVDGTVENGSGFVDEKTLTGGLLPAAKKEGDYLFAGSAASIADLVIKAGVAFEDTLLQRRERLMRGVLSALYDPDRISMAAAGVLIGLPLLLAGVLGFYLEFSNVGLWMPRAAGLMIACAAAAPALAWSGARALILQKSRDNGLIFARMKDVNGLARVRRWQVDGQLLAAPGPVEIAPVVPDEDPDELLTVVHALLSETTGPEAGSIAAEVAHRKLQPSEPAALRRTQAVFHGTVKGARWYLGPRGALEADEGVQVADEAEMPITRLKSKKKIVWLLGRPDKGVVAAIGIEVSVSDDAAVAARALNATLMPGLGDTVRRILADAAGIEVDGPPATKKDGSLLAESSARPSAGLCLLVADPSSSIKLRRGGSPRLMAPAIRHAGEIAKEASEITKKATTAALIAFIVPVLIATALAFVGILGPLLGFVLSMVGLVAAAQVTRGPKPEPTD